MILILLKVHSYSYLQLCLVIVFDFPTGERKGRLFVVPRFPKWDKYRAFCQDYLSGFVRYKKASPKFGNPNLYKPLGWLFSFIIPMTRL